MKLVYVALGSNIGNSPQHLFTGIRMLEIAALGEIKCSSFWNSEPVDMVDPFWFTNAVVQFTTDLAPADLLKTLQGIEKKSGRPEDHLKNSSRTLDLDIISYGNCILDNEALKIPHPKARQRLFVLLPLQELAPKFRFPGDKTNISDLIKMAPKVKMEKLNYSL